MQIASSFIEYLVTGSGALVWILLLLPGTVTELEKHPDWVKLLVVPLVYVLGMLVDFISVALLDLFKLKGLCRQKRSTSKFGPKRHPSDTQFIICHSPELGKELRVRSSRDRIARGALFNVLMLVFALPWSGKLSSLPLRYQIPLFIVLTAVSFLVWCRFEYLTYRFKKKAVQTIEESLNSKEKESRAHIRGGSPMLSIDWNIALKYASLTGENGVGSLFWVLPPSRPLPLSLLSVASDGTDGHEGMRHGGRWMSESREGAGRRSSSPMRRPANSKA